MLTCSFYPVLLLATSSLVSAKIILFIHQGASASHRTAIWPLAEKLGDQGHKITYIFPAKERLYSHSNIEEIRPSDMSQFLSKFDGEINIKMRLNGTISELYVNAFKLSFELCHAFYNSPETKEWLNRPNLHYDLLIMDATLSQCGYGLIHKFKAKHILFMPVLTPYQLDTFGIVPESASIPTAFSTSNNFPRPSELGFAARIMNTLEPIIWYFGNKYFLYKLKPVIEEGLGIQNLLDLSEFDRNTSLVLYNSNFVDDYPMALPPLFVSFAGLWCSRDKLKQRKKIPQDLDAFIGNNSAVYFSFGTTVPPSSMPDEMRETFLKAFESFPDIRFLWRWKGAPLPNKPKNVLIKPSFPQPDLLDDSRVRLFITQAGRPSLQEAICHGVPMITIPIWADQDYNSHRLEHINAAIHMDLENVTLDGLKQAIQEIVYTDKYKEKMRELSTMYRDRPIDPLDNVHYWVEYVLKHDTSLMRSLGTRRTWYERRLLDVYFVIGLVVVTLLLAFGVLLLKVVQFCLKRKQKLE